MKCVVFFFFFGGVGWGGAPHSFRDLSYLTRDRTQAPTVQAQSPIHWTAREFPEMRDSDLGPFTPKRQYWDTW